MQSLELPQVRTQQHACAAEHSSCHKYQNTTGALLPNVLRGKRTKIHSNKLSVVSRANMKQK